MSLAMTSSNVSSVKVNETRRRSTVGAAFLPNSHRAHLAETSKGLSFMHDSDRNQPMTTDNVDVMAARLVRDGNVRIVSSAPGLVIAFVQDHDGSQRWIRRTDKGIECSCAGAKRCAHVLAVMLEYSGSELARSNSRCQCGSVVALRGAQHHE